MAGRQVNVNVNVLARLSGEIGDGLVARSAGRGGGRAMWRHLDITTIGTPRERTCPALPGMLGGIQGSRSITTRTSVEVVLMKRNDDADEEDVGRGWGRERRRCGADDGTWVMRRSHKWRWRASP